MSSLTLTIIRCPEYGSARQRHVEGNSLTVGRGSECDWALPDPYKSLSRRHCQLECVAGTWQVRDLSSNGTFLNASDSAIGRDAIQPLRDGDRLQFGDYEVEIRIEEAAGLAPDFPAAAVPSFGFASVPLPGLDDPVRSAATGLAGPALHAFGAMPDHAPAGAQAFTPPPAAQNVPAAAKALVPDDWYQVEPAGPSPQPTLPVEPAREWPPVSAAVPAMPAVRPAVTEAAPAVFVERQVPLDSTPPAAAAPSATPTTGAGHATGVAALVAGGDLPPDFVLRVSADPDATLRNAGALLRASVAGIRALLIARGSVKREFRIEQTTLRPRENNPLKFAASDEQALTALLDPKTPALGALQEAIQDLTLHQVAVLAATQAAARALLDRLDPGKLEAEDKGGSLFSDSLEKRLWEAYKHRHGELTDQFEDDFESAFGKAFARAYESAVKGIRV